MDIVEVALERKLPVADVGVVYFALSEALHSRWLMDSVEKLPVEGRWHAQARGVLRDELQAQQRALVGNVLASAANGEEPEQLVRQWLGRDDVGSSTRSTCSPTCATCARWTSPPSPLPSAACSTSLLREPEPTRAPLAPTGTPVSRYAALHARNRGARRGHRLGPASLRSQRSWRGCGGIALRSAWPQAASFTP
jgi:hypothetical protein